MLGRTISDCEPSQALPVRRPRPPGIQHCHHTTNQPRRSCSGPSCRDSISTASHSRRLSAWPESSQRVASKSSCSVYTTTNDVAKASGWILADHVHNFSCAATCNPTFADAFAERAREGNIDSEYARESVFSRVERRVPTGSRKAGEPRPWSQVLACSPRLAHARP